MRKADIIQEIHDQTGIPKVDVLVVLESFFKEVKQAVTDGESVSIRRFGTFTSQLRNANIGRNIKANTTIEIPEHYIPKFKPSKEFMVAVKTIKVK